MDKSCSSQAPHTACSSSLPTLIVVRLLTGVLVSRHLNMALNYLPESVIPKGLEAPPAVHALPLSSCSPLENQSWFWPSPWVPYPGTVLILGSPRSTNTLHSLRAFSSLLLKVGAERVTAKWEFWGDWKVKVGSVLAQREPLFSFILIASYSLSTCLLVCLLVCLSVSFSLLFSHSNKR